SPARKTARISPSIKTTGRSSLESEDGEGAVEGRRKRGTVQPEYARMRLRQRGKHRLHQEAERKEEGGRSSRRVGPSSHHRREKDMVATVRTLLRQPRRWGWGRVAGGMLCAVVWRDGGSDRGVGMAGGQARLRTVEDENQEQEHRQ